MDMGLIHGIESHRETGHYPTRVHAQNAIWLQAATLRAPLGLNSLWGKGRKRMVKDG
jgi:hypothetical protein